ncbi:FEKKY domain-containing protein [Flavobacterium hauense]
MKQFITILFFLTSSFSVSAQEKTPQEKFDNDLKKNIVTLYQLGGFAPKAKTQIDLDFQLKYKIRYYDFGCLAPVNISFYEDYNLIALNYLTEKFGRDTIKDVRKDILGFDKWSKK